MRSGRLTTILKLAEASSGPLADFGRSRSLLRGYRVTGPLAGRQGPAFCRQDAAGPDKARKRELLAASDFGRDLLYGFEAALESYATRLMRSVIAGTIARGTCALALPSPLMKNISENCSAKTPKTRRHMNWRSFTAEISI